MVGVTRPPRPVPLRTGEVRAALAPAREVPEDAAGRHRSTDAPLRAAARRTAVSPALPTAGATWAWDVPACVRETARTPTATGEKALVGKAGPGALHRDHKGTRLPT
jgi:hypothetical protein